MSKSVSDQHWEQSAYEEYFQYLDDLRASGETNMYGARPYLVQEFGLEGGYAGTVLSAWMKTFKPGVSVAERAKAAMSKAGETP